MKKLFAVLAPLIVAITVFSMCSQHENYMASDFHIRENVVWLYQHKSTCTGMIIMAPSGMRYILTANHCRTGQETMFMVTYPDGYVAYSEVIASDVTHDLLLLNTIRPGALKIADQLFFHEHVRSIGHGDVLPAFKMEGEIIDIRGPDTRHTICDGNSVDYVISSVQIDHGNSGGPIVDDDGNVVAMADAIDDRNSIRFSCLIGLNRIKSFLSGK